MNIILRVAITVILFLLVDVYIFQAVKVITANKTIWLVYWLVNVGFMVWLIYLLFTFKSMTDQRGLLYNFSGAFILFFVPKLFIGAILLMEDSYRLINGTVTFLQDIFGNSKPEAYFPERRKFVSQMALLVAAVPFTGTLHGILKGRYNFKIRREEIFFSDLPKAFDGLKIVQISDLHIGSFSSTEIIQKGIDKIIGEDPDILVFTGDMVNNEAREMRPFLEQFKSLKAREGKFSILGNHDYGDYIKWESAEAKQANMEELASYHKEIGFKLLLDENVTVQRGDESINIAGVENWGHGFGERGDLKKALKDVQDSDFKVLLSHDPSHWEKEVNKSEKNVQLTLSGHTHGMQFGVEIPGFRWSPVKWRYKTWAGLYKSLGRYIYVNRGFGFIGFPGRVGIWPEITTLILKRKA